MSKIFNPQNKILCHLNKIEKYFANKNPAPITIEIDPSNACNHSCPFCISGHLHLKEYKKNKLFNRVMLDRKIFKNLSKSLVKMNINAINWTGGGEPTLHPHLKENINYIKKNSDIEMGMFSNGTGFKRFNLFETIVDSLSWIRVSLDFGLEDEYNKFRKTNKNNDFKTVISHNKHRVEINKKKNSTLTIGVGFVITKSNYNQIENFCKIFSEIDIDYCQFKPEIIQIERVDRINRKKEQHSRDFWVEKIKNKLSKAESVLGSKFECNSYKIDDLVFDPLKFGRNYKECLGSQFQPCIGADGNVYVCTNHRGHKEFSYGSLYEKNFIEIWNDLKKRNQIMYQINYDQKFSKCTQLCKPHESNKMLWKLKEEFDTSKNLVDIKKRAKHLIKNIKHENFI